MAGTAPAPDAAHALGMVELTTKAVARPPQLAASSITLPVRDFRHSLHDMLWFFAHEMIHRHLLDLNVLCESVGHLKGHAHHLKPHDAIICGPIRTGWRQLLNERGNERVGSPSTTTATASLDLLLNLLPSTFIFLSNARLHESAGCGVDKPRVLGGFYECLTCPFRLLWRDA